MKSMNVPVHRLIGTGGCGGHPHNEVRKIEDFLASPCRILEGAPVLKLLRKIEKFTSLVRILGFCTRIKVASFDHPRAHAWVTPHNGFFDPPYR